VQGRRIALQKGTISKGMIMQTPQTDHSLQPQTRRDATSDHDREVLKLAIRSLLLVWTRTHTPPEMPQSRLH
jgi:hypothetical protein